MQYSHFSVEEREKLQQGIWERRSIRTIARELRRSPSSVAREIKRNLPPLRMQYTPRLAHKRALEKRTSRGRTERMKNQTVRGYVIKHLKKGWSPEQVAGCIASDIGETISHEAIYQYIYAQIHRSGYGYIKPGREDLRPYLKRRHKRRVKKGMRKGQRVFKPKGPSIETRPSLIEKRIRFGDWEGDTIESKDHAPGLYSLVERKSGLVLLGKLKDRTARSTAEAVIGRLNQVPKGLRLTLTTDNGAEQQEWRHVSEMLQILRFYCHPYCSWERGTNENTNGLVRWYFPKGTDFRTIPDEAIAAAEYALNTRPRKRLGWRTPLEVFNQACVALQS